MTHRGAGIKITEWEDMEITSPYKHIKSASTCGKFSQKTSWKLADKLLYNQSCKKDFQVTW